MTTIRGRRQRGAAMGNVSLFATLEPSVKAKLDTIANVTNLSLGLVLEEIIKNSPETSDVSLRRRNRGEASGYEGLAVTIPATTKAKLRRLQHAYGSPEKPASEAVLVELLIKNSQLSGAGFPTWWSTYQEELPIKRAI
ncbi:hypothetical protein [Arthrobacter glacialis]|nr:hypothetical protein [Arthrobacter glacialis]